MLRKLLSLLISPPPFPAVAPTPAPQGSTIVECQQEVLAQLKSGQFVLSSSDKEGYRVLCCHRGAFLYVAVGDDGTSVLRLPSDDVLLGYVWQQSAAKLVLVNGQYQWSYDLTDAEKLENWQGILARLSPHTEGSQRFVARTLAEFAALAAPQ